MKTPTFRQAMKVKIIKIFRAGTARRACGDTANGRVDEAGITPLKWCEVQFVKTYEPNSIISYCDLSKFYGKTYEKLHFSLEKISIGKHWYNPETNVHITDNLLRQQGFDRLLGKQYWTFGKGTSNEQLMLQHGFVEIYDVGQATYIWKSN